MKNEEKRDSSLLYLNEASGPQVEAGAGAGKAHREGVSLKLHEEVVTRGAAIHPQKLQRLQPRLFLHHFHHVPRLPQFPRALSLALLPLLFNIS